MKRWHLFLIFFLLTATYFSAWHLMPTRVITMLVVDKTVPDTSYREHYAIFWIAKHWRFVDSGNNFMKYDQDYLGYHPDDNRKEYLTDDKLNNVSFLYLADTYGIYDYPEGIEVYEKRLPHAHQDIDLIYGGISTREAETIERFAKNQEKMVIGEHNILGYPTYLEPEAVRILENIFAVEYSGWLARYFSELDETAFWIKELYSRIYGLEWNLSGPGMVFIREDATDRNWYTDLVIVTRDQFNAPWPIIRHDGSSELLAGAALEVPYLYWVEVLEVHDEAQVIAYYDLPLKEEAREPLRNRELPDSFPAVVYYTPKDQAKSIYFAGDFADQLPPLFRANLTGSASLQRVLTYMPGVPVEYRFYFQWYAPVMRNLLKENAVND